MTGASGAGGTAGGTELLPATVDVLVVGAGPAGLAAARSLARGGAGRVLVVDRAPQAGGAPAYARPEGPAPALRSGLPSPLSTAPAGPAGAARAHDAALAAGAEVHTGVLALGWAGPRTLRTTGPLGPREVTARAVLLATGAYERPRSARLVAGTRPAGLSTTAELQQTVHLYGLPVGRTAVVVGAGPAGYAAVDTLRGAGTRVLAQVTGHPWAQAPAAAVHRARLLYGVPLLTGTRVTAVTGRTRLTGVCVRHTDGRTATLACDTAVFTGDFVPDHELARHGGLLLDPGTRGPAADQAMRTSREGVFAAGSLLGAVSPRAAARMGADAAEEILTYLADGGGPGAQGGPADPGGPALRGGVAGRGGGWPFAGSVPLCTDAPLHWIAPNRVLPGVPAPGGFDLRTARFLSRPVLHVTQDGRLLHRARHHRTAVPGRPVRLAGEWAAHVDRGGGAVRVSVVG